MPTTGLVIAIWLALTVVFGLVFALGKVYRADGQTKLNLLLWYCLDLAMLVTSWLGIKQGKPELSETLLALAVLVTFISVVLLRTYRASLGVNLVVLAMVCVVIGIPLIRARESGSLNQMLDEMVNFCLAAAALFVAASLGMLVYALATRSRAKR